MRDRPLSREETRAILSTSDSSLLDVVDNLLTKGVVLSGDVVLGIAGIDLIYARLSVLLCAADRVLDRRDDAAGAPRP